MLPSSLSAILTTIMRSKATTAYIRRMARRVIRENALALRILALFDAPVR
jgi:hypothetical protein